MLQFVQGVPFIKNCCTIELERAAFTGLFPGSEAFQSALHSLCEKEEEKTIRSLNEFLGTTFKGYKVVRDDGISEPMLDNAVDAKLKAMGEFQSKNISFSIDEKSKRDQESGEAFRRLEGPLAELKKNIGELPKTEGMMDDFETEASIFSFGN